jgi:hypothetical protein
MICIPKLALEIQDLSLPATVLSPRLHDMLRGFHIVEIAGDGEFAWIADQVASVTPRNSHAARMRGGISMGPSGNLSRGQRFLALDTGKMILRNRWKEIPMPLAVINHVNVLGHAKRSLLMFTDRHGRVIGDYTPTAGETDDTDVSVLSAVNDLHSSLLPVPSEMPGVFLGEEGSADELPGVVAHDVAVIREDTAIKKTVVFPNCTE